MTHEQTDPDPRRAASSAASRTDLAARRRTHRRDRRRRSTPAGRRPSSTPTAWSLLPGLVDLHTHLREPGREDAETVADRHPGRGRSAASPPCTRWPTPPGRRHRRRRRAGLAARPARPATSTCSPVGAVTVGLEGERLAELGAMADSARRGCGSSPTTATASHDAAAHAPRAGVRQGVRRRHRPARPGAAAHRGRPDERGRRLRPSSAWPAGRRSPRRRSSPATCCSPSTSAPGCTSATSPPPARSRSSAGPRPRGIDVTAEVTPHHLLLTDELVARLRPGLQGQPAAAHRGATSQALRDGLADGTIDIVATDHAPHPREDKDCEWAAAAFGMVGLETALSRRAARRWSTPACSTGPDVADA